MAQENLNHPIITNHKTIQELLNTGYSFDFEKVFQKSLELFLENLWTYVAYTAIQFLLVYILLLVPLFGPFICFFLAPYIGAGYYYAIDKSFRKEPVGFLDFYSGFKDKYADILINFVIIAAILAPLGVFSFMYEDLLGYHYNPNTSKVLMFFLPLISLAAFALLFFNIVFLLFENLSPWQAIVTSARFALKNYGPIMGLTLALMVLNLLGAPLAIMGLFFTMPASACVVFTTYVLIFEKDKTSQA